MWVFRAVPDKMVMVYAMVFGAHLLPLHFLWQNVSLLWSYLLNYVDSTTNKIEVFKMFSSVEGLERNGNFEVYAV